MGLSLELVFDSFGLNNPLVGSFSILMDKLGGLVVVHRMNLTFCVRYVWALNLKALDEHFSLFFFFFFLEKQTGQPQKMNEKNFTTSPISLSPPLWVVYIRSKCAVFIKQKVVATELHAARYQGVGPAIYYWRFGFGEASAMQEI